MDELNRIKKVLKVWEGQFLNEQGRKPNKVDIETAPDNIKEFYAKYTKIKKILSTNENRRPPNKEKQVIKCTSGKELVEDKSKMDGPPEDKHSERNTEACCAETGPQNAEKQIKSQDFSEKSPEEGSPREGETQVEVWGSQFDRKSSGSASSKDNKSGNTKSIDSKPSFLHNLGKRLFEQSLKMDNMNMNKSSKPGLHPWRKPDTPRRGLSPGNEEPLTHQAPVSSLVTSQAVIENEGQESENLTSGIIDSNDVIDIKPANFGKMFQKAAKIAKHKGRTDTEEVEEPVVSKFQSSLKPKQTFLPRHLSKLVSKHRETLSFEADIQEEVDVFDTKQVHDIEQGDEDAITGTGHSWNMSVAKLISEDETEEKRRKTIEKIKAKEEKIEKIKAKEEKIEKTRFAEKDKKDESGTETSEIVGVGKVNKRGNNICDSNETFVSNGSKSVSLNECVKIADTKRKSTARNQRSTSNTSEKTTENLQTLDEIHDEGEISLNEIKDQSKRRAKKPRRPVISDDSDDAVPEPEADRDVNEDDSNQELNKAKGARKRKKAVSEGTGSKASKKLKTNAGTAVETAGDSEEPGQGIPAPVKKAPARAKKAASNENFVKLNMKIKTYKRKGRQMTGPQYKRMMWKQKMQARSKSYGDACFKCGQTGHWANKCPGPGAGTGNKYEKEQVLDEDFPSLQEAASMARGCSITRPAKTAAPSSMMSANEDGNEVVVETEPVAMDDEELEIESGIVRSHREVSVAPPPMEPLLKCGEGETLPATPDLVWKGLKKFGFDSFRHGQEEAVMRILCGLSTLVVISTGGGKSLCYQLPAYLYAQRSPCITLVVSPLVSLMEDQVTGLPHGIRGVCLHTNMTASQRESVLNSVKSGKAQFLLVSPEAVAGGSMSLISSMGSLPPVAFACIDEAHCLSEWSHNFRPSYLRLCKVLQERLGVQCFLGLTATATLSSASDVARHLRISDFKRATVRGSPIPPNLVLSVSSDEDKDQALIGLLKGERFGKLESIIIYCTRRDQTDKVATIIRTCMNTGAPAEKLTDHGRRQRPKLEWGAESYHAGLSAAQRKRVQNAFMSGKLRVVVATVAFGMGLDKSDVRGVIHYNMPKSFESYVQEIGRAGRDSERADCHVFLDPEGKDLCELRRHTFANTVDYRTLKRLVQKIFPPCRCQDVHEKHALAVKEAEEMSKLFEDDMVEEDMDTSSVPETNTDVANAVASDTKEGGESVDTWERRDLETVCLEEETDTGQTRDRKRVCPGHERALPIQQTVLELDVKEEGISTLLCYLELHESKWLENMSNVYANCKVQCYAGPGQLQAIARKCPPVAVAIAKSRKDGKSFTNANSIEFSVVDISDTMGWDSGPVKKELKLLMWNFEGGKPVRTGIMVELTDLAFHFRTPGDFDTDELDDILQFLHERVQRQEKSEVYNLSRLYRALKGVSHKNYWMCTDDVDMTRNDKLKAILNEYFDQHEQNAPYTGASMEEPVPEFSEGQLISDIRGFYNMYGQEHTLTGRAVARIFHGIASPCFPATTWGRVRRFWRSHLDVDFNMIMKIATRELIFMRS